MEPFHRNFSARSSSVILFAFLLVALELFVWTALPFESLSYGNFGIVIVIATMLSAAVMLCSRLSLQATNKTFSTSVRVFGQIIFHRSVQGEAWHAVSFPSPSIDGGPNSFTRYRVEVSEANGDRVLVMGGFLGWIYGVDCL